MLPTDPEVLSRACGVFLLVTPGGRDHVHAALLVHVIVHVVVHVIVHVVHDESSAIFPGVVGSTSIVDLVGRLPIIEITPS